MTDTRIISHADTPDPDLPTPAEAHNTSGRTVENIVPDEYGSDMEHTTPTKPANSPPQYTNPKKRKLDSSTPPPSPTPTPASFITTFALYFFAAGSASILTKQLSADRIGLWFKREKIHYSNIKKVNKGYQIIFPNQDSFNAAKKIVQIFHVTVTKQIPNWQQFTRGVIRVNPRETAEDLELYTQEANTNQYPQPQITSTRRITSNRNGKTVPTSIVIVNFKKTAKFPEAPKHISFGAHTKLEVKPYIKQVKQCSNCLRYNHTATQCTFQKTKCKKCAQTDCPGTCSPWCIHCKCIKHTSLSNQCPHRHALTQQANKHINIDSAKIQTRKYTPLTSKPLLPTPHSNTTHKLPDSLWGNHIETAPTRSTHHLTQLPTNSPITSTPACKANSKTTDTQRPSARHSTAPKATTLPHKQAQQQNSNTEETTATPNTQAQNQPPTPQTPPQASPMETQTIKTNLNDEDEYSSTEEINEITFSAPKTNKNFRRKNPQLTSTKTLNNLTLLLAYMHKQNSPNSSTKAFHSVAQKLKLTTLSFELFISQLREATN